ncbi:PepSY-associated TM helix domain-containing protein [Metabacillus iocasae]|uniref:Iron-regulated membrane protein n=1 Tax=Priestia iocasae TaxID=2291674 RepID=A0ABS2QVH7_9BACI|nr:PepSY domain-containing protein [Metabacillus iocasae]MBM7703494.1 putative iron-regulated membrane protein [Metabacillus iocasae]
MEALKLEQEPSSTKKQSKTSLFQSVWRWHFYAGIIFAPFLIILAFSGAVYLFKPQIESTLYKDLYYVDESRTTIQSQANQISTVKEAYPEAVVIAFKTYDDPKRTIEMSILNKGDMLSVYVNPYTGEVIGSLKNEEKFTQIFKKIHSELLIGGTFANLLVELAACWAVILLITGLYIWFPRNKASIWGTILPRFNAKGRTFWRDMHAVPAFWLSLLILVLIATGLPWSGVLGEQINKVANSTNTGYPAFAFNFGEKPESVIKAKDVAEDVPWASENLSVPTSNTKGYVPISLEDVNHIAETNQIKKPYTISMPQGETGVYTIATSHTRPGENATLHIDQYSGSILTDVRFDDYGIMAKAITMGIALHEGRLFGLANQILGLLVCVGLIFITISSFFMWRNRKPQGKVGAPPKAKDKMITKVVFFIMLGMGVLMPLVGLSIVIVFLLDRFVFQKVKRINAWLH